MSEQQPSIGRIVIYNAPFDWPLLMAECARYGVEPPERFPMFLDPLVIDRAADKYRKDPGSSRTLQGSMA